MSTMYVNNIAPLEGNTINVASGKTLSAPGHVIQVISSTASSAVSSSSTTFADTGLSVNITPTSTSSKILVIVFDPIHMTEEPGTDVSMNYKVTGGAIDSSYNPNVRFGIHTGNGTRADLWTNAHIHILDSPNSTSQQTYKTQYKSGSTGYTATVHYNNGTGSITVMEIAG